METGKELEEVRERRAIPPEGGSERPLGKVTSPCRVDQRLGKDGKTSDKRQKHRRKGQEVTTEPFFQNAECL